MKMVFYGKTPVFRDVVKRLQKREFDYYDTQHKRPVFKPAPTLLFEGSVKLHGANCAVSFDLTDGTLQAQSRKHLLTPSNDPDGFAHFVAQHTEAFRDLMRFYAERYAWQAGPAGRITLYGEWAGTGIKADVAIAELPPTFYLFALRYTPAGHDNPFPQHDPSLWFDSRYPKALGFTGLDHVLHYPTYQLKISFENTAALHEAETQLRALTENVAQCCPVAQSHGVTGAGEGIVWVHQSTTRRVLFKTKGVAHQVIKGNGIASTAPRLSSVQDFVDYAVTPNRLKQIESETPGTKDALTFAEALWQDVWAEEGSVITANGLSEQAVRSAIVDAAHDYLVRHL